MSLEWSKYHFSKGAVLPPCLWRESVWKRLGSNHAMQVYYREIPMEVLVVKQWMYEILPWTAIIDIIESNRIWWDLPKRQKVLEIRSRHYCIHTMYLIVSLSTSKKIVINVSMIWHCLIPPHFLTCGWQLYLPSKVLLVRAQGKTGNSRGQATNTSNRLSVCLSVRPSVCLSVRPPVCLSVCSASPSFSESTERSVRRQDKRSSGTSTPFFRMPGRSWAPLVLSLKHNSLYKATLGTGCSHPFFLYWERKVTCESVGGNSFFKITGWILSSLHITFPSFRIHFQQLAGLVMLHCPKCEAGNYKPQFEPWLLLWCFRQYLECVPQELGVGGFWKVQLPAANKTPRSNSSVWKNLRPSSLYGIRVFFFFSPSF